MFSKSFYQVVLFFFSPVTWLRESFSLSSKFVESDGCLLQLCSHLRPVRSGRDPRMWGLSDEVVRGCSSKTERLRASAERSAGCWSQLRNPEANYHKMWRRQNPGLVRWIQKVRLSCEIPLFCVDVKAQQQDRVTAAPRLFPLIRRGGWIYVQNSCGRPSR